jgi:hypothetical protein
MLKRALETFHPAIASVTNWQDIRQHFCNKFCPSVRNLDPEEIEGSFLDFRKVRQNCEESNRVHFVEFLKKRLPFKKGKEIDVVLEYLLTSAKFVPCKVRRVPHIGGVVYTWRRQHMFEVSDACFNTYRCMSAF